MRGTASEGEPLAISQIGKRTLEDANRGFLDHSVQVREMASVKSFSAFCLAANHACLRHRNLKPGHVLTIGLSENKHTVK